ncbi:flavin-containing monooxygenase [Microbacterium sp. DT81.1]|uniref:flavin-containing monooxygenase n=1 Tax=Microbacterium sp. DT81.1 TaxID=3393413 RepID=UPI003CF3BB02
MSAPIDVAIVGAGFAGIGMALALRRESRESFLVLERGHSVGGTWRDNTYPGVACDVPSHLYGFAEHPNPHWSGVFARGAEIRTYLDRVADQVRDHIELDTPLLRARWDGDLWQLDVGGADARRIEAKALVLACGRLTEPSVPDIPGLESFRGPLFHSARWDHSVAVDGARMAVVGTGASAVQLVPELVRRGAAVTLFQRTPAWIVPREGRVYTDAERLAFASDAGALARLRADLYTEGEARYASRSGDVAAAASARSIALSHLTAQVPDPALRKALTPDYAFGCKRVLLSDDFYPAVVSGAVTLEASALAAVEGRALVSAGGARYDADILVLATGFEAARQPYADLVENSDGETLAAHWSRGMTSVASTLISGFPNLFVLNGPNGSLGHNSAVLMMEAQSEFVLRCLADGRTIDAHADAEQAYTSEIDDRAASTSWVAGGCRNWYVDERSGRLTLLWPGTVAEFRERLARIDPAAFAREPSPLSEGTP